MLGYEMILCNNFIYFVIVGQSVFRCGYLSVVGCSISRSGGPDVDVGIA
jgi:hypothetical protein